MNLGVIMAIGESWEDFEKTGQASLWLRNNLDAYASAFNNVYVFSYGKKGGRLLPNVNLVPNTYSLHRYIYALLIPFINRQVFNHLQILRGYQLSGAIPGMIAKLCYKIPLVINYGYDYQLVTRSEGKPIRAYLYKLVERLLIPHVDSVIVTTNALRRRIAYLKNKRVVIPNSIDVNLFYPGKGKKTIDILYVGRFEPQKNLLILLKAYKIIHSRFKGLTLVLVGSGSQEPLLHSFFNENHLSVLLVSPQRHEELVKFYQKAKIFVLPSLIEGQPKALLEAMSCQLAVIGSNVPGVKDLINNRKNGWLVQPTPNGLSTAMTKLLKSSSLRKRLGIAARKSVLSQNNKYKTWPKEINLLKELAR